MMNNMNILIVKPKWAGKILHKNKIWEIRGSNTHKRGRIGIAMSGTGQVYGTVELIDSIPLTKELWESNSDKHQVELSWDELLGIYKKPYAWVFASDKTEVYESPVPYLHKKGAVIWVKNNDIEEV